MEENGKSRKMNNEHYSDWKAQVKEKTDGLGIQFTVA